MRHELRDHKTPGQFVYVMENFFRVENWKILKWQPLLFWLSCFVSREGQIICEIINLKSS